MFVAELVHRGVHPRVKENSSARAYKPLNWMSPLFTPRKRTAEDSRMEWMVTSTDADLGQVLRQAMCRTGLRHMT